MTSFPDAATRLQSHLPGRRIGNAERTRENCEVIPL